MFFFGFHLEWVDLSFRAYSHIEILGVWLGLMIMRLYWDCFWISIWGHFWVEFLELRFFSQIDSLEIAFGVTRSLVGVWLLGGILGWYTLLWICWIMFNVGFLGVVWISDYLGFGLEWSWCLVRARIGRGFFYWRCLGWLLVCTSSHMGMFFGVTTSWLVHWEWWGMDGSRFGVEFRVVHDILESFGSWIPFDSFSCSNCYLVFNLV